MTNVFPFSKKIDQVLPSADATKGPSGKGDGNVFLTKASVLNTETVVVGKTLKKKPRAPGYASWAQMKQRSTNTRHKSYSNYGGRGIRIDPKWMSFSVFIKDMGPPPWPGHSLDRIDPDGNYEKANCRWATKKEQTRNRRTTHQITYDGECLPVAELADRFGMTPRVFSDRLRRNGNNVYDALANLPDSSRNGLNYKRPKTCEYDRWPNMTPQTTQRWEEMYEKNGRGDQTRPEYFMLATEALWGDFMRNWGSEDPETSKQSDLLSEKEGRRGP